MAESEQEKILGDENEAKGLNRDGSAKPTQGSQNSNPERKPVTFSPEQIALIDKMFEERLKGQERGRSAHDPISLYNLRDPKEIRSVKVSRFDGKWVIGFKDLQKDPYKKNKQYLRYGVDPVRRLPNEPYVTLLLTTDGTEKNIEEKEVLLLTYMENRDSVNVPVIETKKKETINDHGILGNNSSFAVAIDDKGNPESRPTILQQSKTVELSFIIQPEGFKQPHEFHSDFLG